MLAFQSSPFNSRCNHPTWSNFLDILEVDFLGNIVGQKIRSHDLKNPVQVFTVIDMTIHIQVVKTNMVILADRLFQGFILRSTDKFFIKIRLVRSHNLRFNSMDFSTVAVHENKGRHHMDELLPRFIINSKATVAKKSIVAQGFRFDGNFFRKTRQTNHLNIIFCDNPDQIIVFQNGLITNSQFNRLHP
ncbi:Uncharacterised protein [Streptococcus pneumoniae]|nr:Uncharacterised protein [Streptococcus pneumoniae]